MPVPDFTQRLDERGIPIGEILLDPNNPRLSLPTSETTPEERIGEEGVQTATLRRLNRGRFDMDGLRSSIRKSGLLPIDKIVVRPLGEGGQFVVVEGNRRIGAIKTLLQQHADGDITLDADVLESIEEPVVLVLEEGDTAQAHLDQWVIQGIRHITGIREWGGYQAARTIQTLIRDLDYEERGVADALNLSIQRVRRSLRVLSALEQMQEDDEFGEFASPELYAFFDEVVKRPKVRDWIGWDDTNYRFTNEDRARMLYSWIAVDDELEDDPPRRLSTSSDVRALDPVLDSAQALDVLNTPGHRISEALRIAEPEREPEWRAPLERAVTALRAIPASVLEELSADDQALIETVRDIAARRLEQAARLRD